LGDGLVARLRAGEGKIGVGRLNFSLETLRQGGWMLVATVVAGVLNYLSNVFVGRMLGPTDYSIFTSLLSLSMILTVMAGVVQTMVTNYVARLRGRGATAEVGTLLVHLIKRLLPWGMGGALALALVSRPLSAFLRIPSALPVVVIGLGLIFMAVQPVALGALRGLQRFGALGATRIGGSAFRLMAAVGLIAVGLGATGAVASLPLASLSTFVLGTFFLGDVLRRRERGAVPRMDGLFEYSIHTALAMVCFAILTNSDVILVKSRFSPTEAGLYSAVATLGKITLWLPGAVVALLLPKAAELHVREEPTAGLARESLLTMGLLCGSITVAFFLFPTPIVHTLFGEQYLANASLLGWYGLAMTLYSLVNVWFFYYLAVQEKRYSYVLLAGATLQVVLLMILPLNPTAVVGILIGTGTCLSLIGMWMFRK